MQGERGGEGRGAVDQYVRHLKGGEVVILCPTVCLSACQGLQKSALK